MPSQFPRVLKGSKFEIKSRDGRESLNLLAHAAPMSIAIRGALSFLDLPGEVRNQIYDLLLIGRPPNRCSSTPIIPRIQTQILLVNRRIYQEASAFLYSMNIFATDSKLRPFLPNFGYPYRPTKSASAMSKITRIRICVTLGAHSKFDRKKAQNVLSRLEEVHLYVKGVKRTSVDYQNLRVFEDVRGVRKARVYGSINSGYADWLERSMMSPVGMCLVE